MKHKHFLLLVVLFTANYSFSQTLDTTSSKGNKYFLHGGPGTMGLFGDNGTSDSPVESRNVFDLNYQAGVGVILGSSNISLNIDFLIGRVSREIRESSSAGLSAQNYRNEFKNVQFIGKYSFKGLKCSLYPFLGTGFGMMNYEIYSDLKDKDGSLYYLWSDGSFRDKGEYSSEAASANIIFRDYDYETTVIEKANAMYVPFVLGFEFDLSPKAKMSIQHSLNYTFSDDIDNIKEGKEDWYNFTSVILKYVFVKRNKKQETEPGFENIDLARLDAIDNDVDLVTNFYDDCVETPSNTNVNKKGCPGDDDKDGIPNHKDLEPNTPENTMVDLNGATVTSDDQIQVWEHNPYMPEGQITLKSDEKEIYALLAYVLKGDNVRILHKRTNKDLEIKSFNAFENYVLEDVQENDVLIVYNYSRKHQYELPIVFKKIKDGYYYKQYVKPKAL
ncbi:hypothetical protein JYU23_00465 [bacterium AH-315-C07]|nr:hypothetical protein [bacterium AH-315-C07]